MLHKSFALLLSASLSGGCASVAVTDDAIITNTSRALGLERNQFTISDRSDSGLQTTYTARTRSGKTYSCYVEGSVSVVGRVVSDALCREMSRGGAPAAPAAAAPVDPSCNALLRAAGRCK